MKQRMVKKIEMKDKNEFIKYLQNKAEQFEIEAADLNNGFSKGYFEGKAEVLYQVADSIFDETGSLDDETGAMKCQTKP